MGFQTPLYKLSDYLERTTSGRIQLPDFQRGYKWDDERIRQLLVTILRGHPLGVVMLLKTGNDQIRFKPRPVEGVTLPTQVEPEALLLDGQQRLTSLTQALTGTGVVNTEDDRGKKMARRYFINMNLAIKGEDYIEEAVRSLPADGVLRSNFGRDIDLDVSTAELQHAHGYYPVNLLFDPNGVSWLFCHPDKDLAQTFHAKVVQPVGTYQIPAIELDTHTSKAAVATVFEKVNTGGLPLNVFELLTATFAGDKAYYEETGQDFRLNDDWSSTKQLLSQYPVLEKLESTDFLQIISLYTTVHGERATTARKEDILRLDLRDYLQAADPAREALAWTAAFLDELHLHVAADLPYPKLIVPLATVRMLLGSDADLHGVNKKLRQWFWCGVFGELYGSTIETRFARDVEQVPVWALASEQSSAPRPRTVEEANFFQSRLYSLRTRNSAAYKGIYALLMAQDTRDWMYNKPFNKAHYVEMQVDIHHIFPKAWCIKNGIDPDKRESIINKTPLAKRTNIKLSGDAPSHYLQRLEASAGIPEAELETIVGAHQVAYAALQSDDFDSFFCERRDRLTDLIEQAMGKPVVRDMAEGSAGQELPDQFSAEPEDEAEESLTEEDLDD